MLIILLALVLVQATYLLFAVTMTFSQNLQQNQLSAGTVESEWHEAANRLETIEAESVQTLFAEWKERYPEASMFWVDGDNRLALQMDVKEELPELWTASFTVKFIKERYDGDPFTVIAFVGKFQAQGFIVLELPRSVFDPPFLTMSKRFGDWIIFGTITIVLLFIVISFLFFRGIRKRLLQLQKAMSIRGADGLPVQTEVKKQDEIGQLEQSFNEMVVELKKSKQREQEEEQLRRELMANLSHDLRTPLTKMRAQTHSISREKLSVEGRQAIQAMESSVDNMDRLIDNLMSYTLLMGNKLKFQPRPVDIVRFVREHTATWYPVFEKEQFEIDVQLQPLLENTWQIDPIWMGRVLDNLFQNVLRHAKSGRYIAIRTESTGSFDAVVVQDRGHGFQGNPSEEKGVGIGLTIVDLMMKGMHLDWEIESNGDGTLVRLKRL
jgi:signal transduction histidine kinase